MVDRQISCAMHIPRIALPERHLSDSIGVAAVAAHDRIAFRSNSSP